MPMPPKPLLMGDVPAEFRDLFDFGSQDTLRIQGNGAVAIRLCCKECGEPRVVASKRIRRRLAAGRFTGMCNECYLVSDQNRRHMAGLAERQGRGPDSHNWKGGWYEQEGYKRCHWITFGEEAREILEPMSDRRGCVLEHRAVMALSLGRPLKLSETVHHRNGRKMDNGRANLELRIGNHGVGATVPHCQTCICWEGER